MSKKFDRHLIKATVKSKLYSAIVGGLTALAAGCSDDRAAIDRLYLTPGKEYDLNGLRLTVDSVMVCPSHVLLVDCITPYDYVDVHLNLQINGNRYPFVLGTYSWIYPTDTVIQGIHFNLIDVEEYARYNSLSEGNPAKLKDYKVESLVGQPAL